MTEVEEIQLALKLSAAIEETVLLAVAAHADTENDFRSLVMSTLDMATIRLIRAIEPPRAFNTIVGVHADHVRLGLAMGAVLPS